MDKGKESRKRESPNLLAEIGASCTLFRQICPFYEIADSNRRRSLWNELAKVFDVRLVSVFDLGCRTVFDSY